MVKSPSFLPSSTTRPPPQSNRNALLAALPAADYERIFPTLHVIPLKLKHVLYKPGERIQKVYFPAGGFCSVLTVLEDGAMVEVATIGREGMVGATAAFDGNPPQSQTMVQGETDTCYQMTTDAFRREMDRRGKFYEVVSTFTQALIGFTMQSTACNAVHWSNNEWRVGCCWRRTGWSATNFRSRKSSWR
jgi:CRP-like cAMP-binding protein